MLRRKIARIGRSTAGVILNDEEGRPHWAGRIVKNLFCCGNTFSGNGRWCSPEQQNGSFTLAFALRRQTLSGLRMTPKGAAVGGEGFGRGTARTEGRDESGLRPGGCLGKKWVPASRRSFPSALVFLIMIDDRWIDKEK